MSRRLDSAGRRKCLLSVLIVPVCLIVGQNDCLAQDKSSEARRAQWATAVRLSDESLRLRARGELPAAIRAASQSAEIQERLFGAAELSLPGVSESLIRYDLENGDLDAARRLGRRLRDAKQSKLTAKDWQVRHLERLLAEVDQVASWNQDRRDKLREAGRLAASVLTLSADGKPADALRVAESLGALRASLYGEAHFNSAISLLSQGQLRSRLGDRDGAERCFRSAVQTFEATAGRDHPFTAMCYDQLGQLALGKGDLEQANAAFGTCAAVRRNVLGARHPLYGWTLAQWGDVLRRRREYPRAVTVLEQALDNLTAANGKQDATTRYALMALAQTVLDKGDLESAKKRWEESAEIESAVAGRSGRRARTARGNLVVVERQLGRFAEAERRLGPLLDDIEHGVGVPDREYTSSLIILGQTQASLGEVELAQKSLKRAVDLRRESLPKDPAEYASALLALSDIADVGDALPLLREARQMLEKENLGKTVSYATCLVKLGERSIEIGDRDRGLAQARDGLQLLKDILGGENDNYLADLAVLAALCEKSQRYSESVQIWHEVLDGHRKTKPGTHFAVIAAQASLASALIQANRFAEAEPLVNGVVAAYEASGQTQSHSYAAALQTQGFLYDKRRDRRKAVDTLRHSADVFAQAHMPSLETDSLKMAAMSSWALLDFAGAEQLARRAESATKLWATDRHPAYADVLAVEAKILASERRVPEAMSLYLQAAEIHRRLLDKAFGAVSEREQFVMTAELRENLDSYLSLSSTDTATASTADQANRGYEAVLAWKGASYFRQRRVRLLRSHPEVGPLFRELSSISSQLASFELRPVVASAAGNQAAARRLSERREQLEGELSRRASSFSDPVFDAPVNVGQLSAALPKDAVLLDYLEYNPWLASGERQLAVFVIRAGQPIARVDLGPVELIRKAIADWQPNVPRPVTDLQQRAAIRLRKLIWRPVSRWIRPKMTVFVSPDGAVAGVPFVALPGDKLPYLVEERAIGIIPVPRLLPHLLRSSRAETASATRARAKLLLVGDVDYDAEPPSGPNTAGSAPLLVAQQGERSSDAPSRSLPMAVGSKLHFDRLNGTKGEIAAILQQWNETHPGQSAVTLIAGNATKRNVCQTAEQSQVLHLATHGFSISTALDRSPAVSAAQKDGRTDEACGIALAGANRLFNENSPAPEDGVLTGLEAAQLGLEKTDLVVLSACETGVGKSVGGEGLLSLQRAFQVAGAHSVIASLWKVPDQGTRALMERFYSNLWKTPSKPPGPLSALREAQLWMLNEGSKQRDLVRGLGIAEADADSVSGRSRLPPYFWAAFAVSGDWR